MLDLHKTVAWAAPRRSSTPSCRPPALSHRLGVLLAALPERIPPSLWKLEACGAERFTQGGNHG
jgi:hypothetical protein